MNTHDSPTPVLHEPPPQFFQCLELRHVFLGLIGVGAIAIACIPSVAQQRQAAGPTTLHVTASEFKFQADTPNVAAGQPVTITFENKGTIEHNLDLHATGTHLVAEPGQTVTTTVTFPSSGDLTYVCTVPGHEQAGMSSTLQVGGASGPLPGDTTASGAKSQATPEAPLAPLPHGQVAPPVHRSDPALGRARASEVASGYTRGRCRSRSTCMPN